MPISGSTSITATKEMQTASPPAKPNVRISADCENSRAPNDSSAVACASTHAGPTTRTANRTASPLVSPSRRRMRMAETICMLSAKPITITSGVMTLRNRLSLIPSRPRRPSDHSTASTGGSAASSISDTRLKKMTAMMAPNSRPRPL